jgi:hypothetical protein
MSLGGDRIATCATTEAASSAPLLPPDAVFNGMTAI